MPPSVSVMPCFRVVNQYGVPGLVAGRADQIVRDQHVRVLGVQGLQVEQPAARLAGVQHLHAERLAVLLLLRHGREQPGLVARVEYPEAERRDHRPVAAVVAHDAAHLGALGRRERRGRGRAADDHRRVGGGEVGPGGGRLVAALLAGGGHRGGVGAGDDAADGVGAALRLLGPVDRHRRGLVAVDVRRPQPGVLGHGGELDLAALREGAGEVHGRLAEQDRPEGQVDVVHQVDRGLPPTGTRSARCRRSGPCCGARRASRCSSAGR